MLSENLDATSAAFRVGYSDASHFNRSIRGSLACRRSATSSASKKQRDPTRPHFD